MTELRTRMIDDLRIRNYSPNTIDVYVRQVAFFSRHFGVSPDRLGPEHVRVYLLHLVNKGAGMSTMKQAVCALRFFYRETLGRKDAIKFIEDHVS